MPRLSVGDDVLSIAALILDKDGTLHRFDRYWVPLVEARLSALTRRCNQPPDDLRQAFGITPAGRVLPDGLLAQGTRAEAVTVAVAWLHGHGWSWMAARAAAGEAFAEADGTHRPQARIEPIPGLHDWLAGWHAAGGLSAIASTASRADVELAVEALGLDTWIPWRLGGDDPVPVKPQPDAVHHLCAAMGVRPAEVLVVGDGVNDLQMGRAAGVAGVVGVLTGVEPAARLAEHADWVVPDLTHLRLC
jgi:phosphoglycolate phosphatase-like HAD superfamily hydrolase